MTILSRVFAPLMLVSCLALVGAEESKPAEPSFEVVNEAGKVTRLTMTQLDKLPRTELVIKDRKGDEVQYVGVTLNEVLKEAGVATGSELKGKHLANYLLVEAADKYRVVFSLPEIDPVWSERVVLLATTLNGEPLASTHGPFQIVASGEKLHSRWVKQVVKLTVRTDVP